MGLIKTAIMSGTALYGINKLSKSYQTHEDSRATYPQPNQQIQYDASRAGTYQQQRNQQNQYDAEYQREMEAARQRYQNRQYSPWSDRSRGMDGSTPEYLVNEHKQGSIAAQYYSHQDQEYSRRPQAYQDQYQDQGGHWLSEEVPPYEKSRGQQGRQTGFIEREQGRSGNMLDSVLSMASGGELSGKKGKGNALLESAFGGKR